MPVVLFASLALAAPVDTPSSPWSSRFVLAGYAAARGGSYAAGGVGGRARWEPTPHVGVDVYLEATRVGWEGGLRHDYPNGFNVYTPIALGRVRVRPYAGFCDVVSLVEPSQPDAPRADDVLLGAHAGIGAEVAIAPTWSVFLDTQVDAYAGHDRASGGWTGDVAESLTPFVTAQANLGVQLHLPEAR